jgi:D-3-phosphoglycerate dehydrogenase
MRVMVFDPFVSNAPEGVEVASLDEVLSQSEVISLHCPLTSDNRNLINRETISRMRDGVIIVNTARGGLVDEEAVIEAIRAGKIRAAGLDSFHTEPLTGEHHFTGVPNLILTPHVGGGTTDAYVNMGTAAARNVLDALKQ